MSVEREVISINLIKDTYTGLLGLADSHSRITSEKNTGSWTTVRSWEIDRKRWLEVAGMKEPAPATFTQADLDAAVAKARREALEEAAVAAETIVSPIGILPESEKLDGYRGGRKDAAHRIRTLAAREKSSREREPQEKEGHPFGNSY